jgi:hypothetical protein
MSASNALETGLLGLIITNVACANIGDAGGLQPSATAGVFWISLTVTPGHTEGGNQTTNEIAYTNYARQDEARNTSQWTVTGGTADNDNAIGFPACGVTGATAFGFGLGSVESGAGNIMLIGDLTATLIINSGITPSFAAGALDITLE